VKLTIQITDDTYERYAAHAATTPGSASAEEMMAAQLARFEEVRPSDRIVVVDSRHRARLEDLLPSGGSLKDAADLVNRVDRLARIEIGEVKVPFTVGELEELSYRARHQGRKHADLIEEAVAAWHEQFFNWPDTRGCPKCSTPPPVVQPSQAVSEAKPAPPALDIAAVHHVEHAILQPIQPVPEGSTLKGLTLVKEPQQPMPRAIPSSLGGAMKPPVG